MQPEALKAGGEAEVWTLVRQIIGELAPSRDAAAGAPLDDAHLIESLQYNSLALLELAFALEDEFDLPTIDEATARKITTVRDVAEHVVRELRAAGRL
jgi:acyl carrier protein